MKDLIIVSNRGPFGFSASFLEQAEAALTMGVAPESPKFGEGGLVQAMAGLLKAERWSPTWVGASMGDKDIDVAIGNYSELFKRMYEQGYTPQIFPEIEIDPDKRIHFKYKEYDFYMRLVFFDTEHMHSYYSIFANGFLWPLLHLTRGPVFYKACEKIYPKPYFKKNDFLQYNSSGVTFAHTVFDETRKSRGFHEGNDLVVWNQDYHLMQVAESYKALLATEKLPPEKRSKIHLGHFMHTPFFNIHEIQGLIRDDKRSRIRSERFDPFVESIESVLQKLTWGMLANDFIGFHHKEYCDNYLEALQEWFPRYHVDIRQGEQFYEISHPNGITTLGVFPIGLDVDRVLAEVGEGKSLEYDLDGESLGEKITRDRRAGRYIFGGLERCDYTKGLLARLGIFGHSLNGLRKAADLEHDARLYQVTAPSRSDNPDYQHLERTIAEEAERWNREFEDDPIVHIRQGVPPPQNYRLMKEVDVMLVTPLEDGMNLVAFEYILSQKFKSKRGMLVLGNCGAARVLKSAGFAQEDGIIYTDPLLEEDAAHKILAALKQKCRISDKVLSYIESECRVGDWAQKNIDAIINCKKSP